MRDVNEPGRPGRIVVSADMLDALAPAKHQTLLAHEPAHLTHHHYLFVVLAQLAAANPLLRPLATTVTFTVERRADGSAATIIGDRGQVARTICKATSPPAAPAPAAGSRPPHSASSPDSATWGALTPAASTQYHAGSPPCSPPPRAATCGPSPRSRLLQWRPHCARPNPRTTWKRSSS
ncbi:M48 family metalloprotease [Kitasatospora sp. NPDC058170]|uniref:M48 family metalloprotease n=1 Tax=Kitasatospora sp. NPDC058170 TaxID=3346364 RepID=UPI0036DD0EF1